VRQWLAEAPENARDPAPYQRLLSLIRERGYAVTLMNPVRSQLGEVVASLSDSPHQQGLRHRMTSLIAEMGLDIYHLAAIDPAQSYAVGMLSAPIFNVHGHAAFTLSLQGFKEPLKADAIQELAERLMTSCLMVTRNSNGRVPSLDSKHSKGGRR